MKSILSQEFRYKLAYIPRFNMAKLFIKKKRITLQASTYKLLLMIKSNKRSIIL